MKFDKEYFNQLFTKPENEILLFLNLHGVNTAEYSDEYRNSVLKGTLYVLGRNYVARESEGYYFRLRLYGAKKPRVASNGDIFSYKYDNEILEVFKKYFDVKYVGHLGGEELTQFIENMYAYNVYLKFKE